MNRKMYLNPRLMFIEEPSEEPGGGKGDSAPKGAGGKAETELPQWAQDELSRVRREAARYRTERNDFRDKFKDAKSPEDVAALVAAHDAKTAALELDLTRERVARKAGLPDDLAERLRGSDETELEADAKALQKYASPAKRGGDDPKGGLDPTDEPEDTNYDELANDLRALSY